LSNLAQNYDPFKLDIKHHQTLFHSAKRGMGAGLVRATEHLLDSVAVDEISFDFGDLADEVSSIVTRKIKRFDDSTNLHITLTFQSI
jgi:hypothetical protein